MERKSSVGRVASWLDARMALMVVAALAVAAGWSSPTKAADEMTVGMPGEGTPVGLDETAPEVESSSDEPELSFAFDLAFNSKYVWRGQTLTDDPVMQPSFTVAYGNLSLNLWGNVDLGDVNGNDGNLNELDVTLDWTQEICGPLSMSFGVIYYDFPNTNFNDTWELYIGASLDYFLSPSTTVYFDIDEVDGVYWTFDFGHSFDVPEIPDLPEWMSLSTLDIAFGIAWADHEYNVGYFGVNSSGWNDFHASVSLPIAIGDCVTVTPTVAYTSMIDETVRNNTADADVIWYGVNIGCSF